MTESCKKCVCLSCNHGFENHDHSCTGGSKCVLLNIPAEIFSPVPFVPVNPTPEPMKRHYSFALLAVNDYNVRSNRQGKDLVITYIHSAKGNPQTREIEYNIEVNSLDTQRGHASYEQVRSLLRAAWAGNLALIDKNPPPSFEPKPTSHKNFLFIHHAQYSMISDKDGKDLIITYGHEGGLYNVKVNRLSHALFDLTYDEAKKLIAIAWKGEETPLW